VATRRISITLDEGILEALQKRAQEEHRKLSNLIAHLLTEVIKGARP
jgi:hypothetical protein